MVERSETPVSCAEACRNPIGVTELFLIGKNDYDSGKNILAFNDCERAVGDDSNGLL